MQQIPTVADLRAKRLELTRASLRERLLQGDLDDVRVVIQSLADEFDVVDVAAAAVKLAQVAARRDGDIEIPEPRGAEPGAERRERGRVARPARTSQGGEKMTRIFVGAGRQAGVRPADLVGAIAGEAGIASRELGTIEIADRFALIEVPEQRADDIVAAMNKATLRGEKVRVRRDREGPRAFAKKPGRTAPGRTAS